MSTTDPPQKPIVPPGRPPPPPPEAPSNDDEPTEEDPIDPAPQPVASPMRTTMPSDPDMPWARDVELELLRCDPPPHERRWAPLFGTVCLDW